MIKKVVIWIICLVSLFGCITTVPAMENKVEFNEDWIVRQDEVHEGEDIILKGRLKVESGKSLTLKNCSIRIIADEKSIGGREDQKRIFIDGSANIQASDCKFTTNISKGVLIFSNHSSGFVFKGNTFGGVGFQIDHTNSAVLENNIFYLSNEYDFPGVSFLDSQKASFIKNKVIPDDEKTYKPNRNNKELFLYTSDEATITNNYFSGLANSLTLHTTSRCRLTGNTIIGPDSPPELREKVSNWWVASSFDKGDGAIGILNASNNNIIENNKMISSGSAMTIIFQSENNIYRNNEIKGAGYGLCLKTANSTIIDNNTFTDIWDDGIQIYRSDKVQVFNNKIDSANGGLCLFFSDKCKICSNSMMNSERGFFVYIAKENTISGNTIDGSYEGIVADRANNNSFTGNNFINTARNAYDGGINNIWSRNYWGRKLSGAYQITKNVMDLKPAMSPISAVKVEAPPAAENVTCVPNKTIEITGTETWENQDIKMNGSIKIGKGARLILKHTTLTYSSEVQLDDIWIHVQSGGALEIYDSKIYGPAKRNSLSIKAYKDSEFIMKNSLLENAGSWVGTFAAAIALENIGSIIENNIIRNSYCAVCTENTIGKVRITGNKIENSIKGITLIGSNPDSVVSGNTITGTAYWGLQHYSGPEDSKSCVIQNNTFTDSWGVGIYDTRKDSATIKDNTFKNINGPAILCIDESGKAVNIRQLRVLSCPAAETGEISIKVGYTELFGGKEPEAFKPKDITVCLYSGGKVVMKQSVNLGFGKYKRVILNSSVIKQGGYSVVIEGSSMR